MHDDADKLNKKRLIDVDAAIKRIDDFYNNPPLIHPGTTWRRGVELVSEIILEEPIVDAIEVVRCKDCKWYRMSPIDSVPYCCHESGYCGEHMGGLFFCACGERKME